MNRNSTNYWYMDTPIIGNVAALVNSSGAIQEGYTYRGYGQATVHTGAGNDGVWFTSDDATASSSALGNPYLFTGREWDSTISLQYSRARRYAPTPGRWFARDPLGYRDGFNLYEYVASAPTVYSDLWGLCGDDIHKGMTNGYFDPLRDICHPENWANLNILEDKEHGTMCGIIPILINFPRHFGNLGEIKDRLRSAIMRCDQWETARLLHQGQDSICHGEGPLAVFGNILNCLDPNKNPDRKYDWSKAGDRPVLEKLTEFMGWAADLCATYCKCCAGEWI